MLKELDNYDWAEVFCETTTFGDDYNTPDKAIPNEIISVDPFYRKDVEKIHGIVEGQYDGESWIIYGKLKDSRHFYLEAGCCYSGWEVDSSGSSMVSLTKENIEKFGMGDDSRKRFGIKL